MSDELKACPFCASSCYHYPDDSAIWCGKCDEGIVEDPRIPIDIKTRWNTRPIEDDLRAKLALAVEALENVQCPFDGSRTCECSGDEACCRTVAQEALAKIRES
jgi:hypothetical protein